MELDAFFIIVLLLFLVGLGWWMFFRKKKWPIFPLEWQVILKEKVPFYTRLSEAEKRRFEKAIQVFFDDVSIIGVEIEIDDTDRLLVAASAVIPLFGFPGWRYQNLSEVLLYKGTFDANYATDGKHRNIIGMVGSGTMHRMMILSQPALHQGFDNRHSKGNVGIHEFVHLLDKADGATDGIPDILMQQQYVIPWLKRMHEEIKEIKTQRSNINPYGATNEAEFLSVVSEYFFKRPQLFEKKHPELFAFLEKIYRQDLT